MGDNTSGRWGRRRYLEAIGTTVTIGSAGCVRSDEPATGGSVPTPTFTETENREIDADLEFTAAAVGVGERALSEANYEERRAFDHGMTRTYELGDQSFTTEVVSQLAEYHRRVDLERFGEQEVARFAVLSTPRVELGFQTFNPLDGITEEALLEGLQSEYEDVRIGERVDSRVVEVLGWDVSVAKRRGTARYRGRSVEIHLHVERILRNEDFMTLIGIYPRRIDEADSVHFLMEHTEYSV